MKALDAVKKSDGSFDVGPHYCRDCRARRRRPALIIRHGPAAGFSGGPA